MKPVHPHTPSSGTGKGKAHRKMKGDTKIKKKGNKADYLMTKSHTRDGETAGTGGGTGREGPSDRKGA